MLSSFFSGISGLVSNSQSINVVGNNIANVNTIGFKASRATFEDVLYQSIFGTSGTSQVGRGSALASVDTLFSQGSFESTSEPTDLAIGGKGFFIVKSQENQTSYFTRAGQFRFDKEGRMVNPAGYVLQGKQIDRLTNTAFGVDTDIIISPEPSEPRKTSAVDMVTNLQSNAASTARVSSADVVGGITTIATGEGKYPWAGDYTATYTANTAATITLTGSSVPSTAAMAGTLIVNGVSVDVGAVTDLAGLVTAINTAMAAQVPPMTVVASAGGTGTDRLTLTATANGTDILLNDSGLTSGSTGWSTADKASTALYGTTLALSVPEVQSDGTITNVTHTGLVGANRGTITNWQGLGLDITTAPATNYILPTTTQNFNVSGFVYQDADLTALVNPSTTSNYSSSITVYDSLGQPHVATVYFRKAYDGMVGGTQMSKWQWNAVVSGTDWYYAPGETAETYHLVGTGYLDFNNNGVLTAGGDPQTLTFNFAGADPGQRIDFVFGNASGGGSTTQYPIASKTNYQSQDGYPPGVLQNVTVSQEGTISGHYSNGQILDLYKVTLAEFNNSQGLRREGGNLFSATLESGTPFTNAPGEGGLGKINPNSLEQSNVDLATEFVKMIIAQRGFQANSRVITTTDEVLQELMNLKR